MDQAIATALAQLRPLSSAQLRGVVTALAATTPWLLSRVAQREDLDAELREHLLRQAPPYMAVRFLEQWPATTELVDAVRAAHGALPELVAYCGVQGWHDLAAALARDLEWRDVPRAASSWPETASGAMPTSVRIALIEAALTERDPLPTFASMTEWEKREVRERLESERTSRAEVAWSLLEQHEELWVPLAREAEHSTQIRRILLNVPTDLGDEVLLACLPEVLGDHLRGEKYMAEIRLRDAAAHVRRRPRLRELAAEEIKALVREVVADGWTVEGRYRKPDWGGIAALAELSDDGELLKAAVDAVQAAHPSDYDRRDRDRLVKWSQDRSSAVVALAANRHVPHAWLIDLLPGLDEHALRTLADAGHSELSLAAQEHLTRLRAENEAKLPKIVPVPDDDELAVLDDPVAELRAHLEHLRGRAAQRDATIDGLLRSRHTTLEILRALPAARVLNSAEQAGRVAGILAEVCGEQEELWRSLPAHFDPPPARNVTFGAFVDRLQV
ncbi:hypothetical protein ACFYOT_35700 [Saccharothrix saharensis]|uniref:hypothetical protein n=1 Tax=Saccharothrix saharensis TaxID=571190 RepID=UPI0036A456AC